MLNTAPLNSTELSTDRILLSSTSLVSASLNFTMLKLDVTLLCSTELHIALVYYTRLNRATFGCYFAMLVYACLRFAPLCLTMLGCKLSYASLCFTFLICTVQSSTLLLYFFNLVSTITLAIGADAVA